MEGSKGIVALAMEKAAPYGITMAAVPGSAEDWCATLPRECHLLYFDVLPDAPQAEHLCRVLFEKVNASVAGFFAVSPHEAVRTFLSVKEYLEAEASKGEEAVEEEQDGEGERLNDLALEYDRGSLRVIKDPKRAFELFKQSAELGYPMGILNLSVCYCEGSGVKKDLNTALQLAYKCIEPSMPTHVRLMGFSNVSGCFRTAEMYSEAEQTWRRCFTEMAREFEREHPTALAILGDYGFWCEVNKCSPVHSRAIARLFPAVVELILSNAKGRVLDGVEQIKQRWLLANSPS